MCMYEFLTGKTVENKRWFCYGHCPIEYFDCCGISDNNIEELKSRIDLEITKLKLVREMLDK